MKVEFFGIGSEVYFINDEQKITCGYITEICYNAKRISSPYGHSCWIRETVSYVIDNQFQRNEKFIFKTREELIKSL